MLEAGVGWGLAAAVRPGASLATQADAAAAPPQENDQLAFALGSRQGAIITPDDIVAGALQVFAYPVDPASGLVRDGTRLNQAILLRLDAAELDADTAARAADGIVAYSGVCSHTGCDVTEWLDRPRTLLCPCHETEFDPARGAEVVGGPARRRLAALPLKIVEGALLVAGGFIGPVGAAEQP